MYGTRWWDNLRLASLMGLLGLLLAGCEGGTGSNKGTALEGNTRLLLQVTTLTAGQTRALRADPPGQTRVGERVTRIRIEVRGVGLDTPLVVECLLTGPSTPQCQITTTATSVTVVIELLVPSGTNRIITVTAFDQEGAPMLRGQQAVDLTQITQTLQITLDPQTGTIGATLSLLAQDAPQEMAATPPVDWRLLARPATSQAVVVAADGHQPSLLLDHAGTYLLELTVREEHLALGDLRLALGVLASAADFACTWTLLTAPPDSTVPLAAACAQMPTLVADVPGVYVFQLVMP